MKNLGIAKRYAKALLLIGKEDKKVEVYRKELDGFAKLLDKEKELDKVINNPLYEASGRKKVLQAVIKKLNLSSLMKSFLLLLFDKRRIGFIGNINEFYQKLSDEIKGVAHASLVSAVKLSPETIEEIRKTLSKKTGKDIFLEVEQDKNLIGGVVTKIGDLVLDGSIKTQLLNMRESLKRSESI